MILQLEVEIPKPAEMPWPPPLIEGVTEDMHREFIATPAPTPVQEVGKAETKKLNSLYWPL